MSRFRLVSIALTVVILCAVVCMLLPSTAYASSEKSPACNGVTNNDYWWGTQVYVPQCGVQLLAAGVSLAALDPELTAPAAIAVADVEVAAALSCNGTIFVDIIDGPFHLFGPVYIARPSC